MSTDDSEKNYPSDLFITKGKPINFLMLSGTERNRLRPLITSGGGRCTGIQMPGLKYIQLQDPNNSECLLPDQPIYYSRYIDQCIDAGALLDLEPFRVKNDHSKSDGLQETLKFIKRPRLELKTATVNLNKRVNFSHSEDIAILDFIRRGKRYYEVGGNALWQEMAETKTLKDHSWQSLKERFRKRIYPRLHVYGLNAELMQKFKLGKESGTIMNDKKTPFHKRDDLFEVSSDEEEPEVISRDKKNGMGNENSSRAPVFPPKLTAKATMTSPVFTKTSQENSDKNSQVLENNPPSEKISPSRHTPRSPSGHKSANNVKDGVSDNGEAIVPPRRKKLCSRSVLLDLASTPKSFNFEAEPSPSKVSLVDDGKGTEEMKKQQVTESVVTPAARWKPNMTSTQKNASGVPEKSPAKYKTVVICLERLNEDVISPIKKSVMSYPPLRKSTSNSSLSRTKTEQPDHQNDNELIVQPEEEEHLSAPDDSATDSDLEIPVRYCGRSSRQQSPRSPSRRLSNKKGDTSKDGIDVGSLLNGHSPPSSLKLTCTDDEMPKLSRLRPYKNRSFTDSKSSNNSDTPVGCTRQSPRNRTVSFSPRSPSNRKDHSSAGTDNSTSSFHTAKEKGTDSHQESEPQYIYGTQSVDVTSTSQDASSEVEALPVMLQSSQIESVVRQNPSEFCERLVDVLRSLPEEQRDAFIRRFVGEFWNLREPQLRSLVETGALPERRSQRRALTKRKERRYSLRDKSKH